MKTLFIILSLFGLMTSLLTGSLIVSNRKTMFYSLIQAAPVLLLVPLILRTALQHILRLSESPDILANLALVLIIENCIALFTSLSALKVHHGLEKARAVWLFYMPSISAAAGALLIIALIIKNTAGVSYRFIGIAGIITFAVLIFALGYVFKYIISSWATRLELKALLSILAICTSMVIPLFNSPITIQGSALSISYMNILILSLVIGLGAGTGFGFYYLRSKREYR